jgi:ABC-type nitrate/sulfonate/bicarbonate transport system substrate-binding protein
MSRNLLPLARTWGLLVSIVLLFSAILTACGEASPTPAATTTSAATAAAGATTSAADTTVPSGTPDKVKVVHVPGLFFAPLYVAIDKGYFKEQNIEISLDKAGAGSEVMAFLAQGQIDVGAVGLSAASFNALNKGFDFKVIASAAIAPAKNIPSKFEIKKTLIDNGTVKKISDLKGKKIAVAGGTGSTGAYLAVKALQTDGLTAKDVQFVNLANPDMLQALNNGAVDAALMGTPFSTQAIQQGVGAVLADDFAPSYATTTYMFSGKFIKDHPDVAKRFAVALLKGYRAIQGSNYLSDDNVKTYVKYTGSTEAIIRSTPPLVYDPNMIIGKDSIVDQEKVYRESGWTEYSQAIDVQKMLDSSFAENAIKVVGPAS